MIIHGRRMDGVWFTRIVLGWSGSTIRNAAGITPFAPWSFLSSGHLFLFALSTPIHPLTVISLLTPPPRPPPAWGRPSQQPAAWTTQLASAHIWLLGYHHVLPPARFWSHSWSLIPIFLAANAEHRRGETVAFCTCDDASSPPHRDTTIVSQPSPTEGSGEIAYH